MRAKRIVIVAVIALLTMAIAFGVSAQDTSGGSNGGQSGQTSGQQGFSGQNQNFGQGNVGFNNLATNGQQSGLFPSGQGNTFFMGLNGAMPRNATLLGVAFLDGFNTYTFDMNALFGTTFNTQNQANLNTQNQTNFNTQTNQGLTTTQGQNNQGQNNQGQNTAQNNVQFANLQQCGNVRVYKLSPQGVQDLWPNVSCNGSLLSVQAGGRGHYIMYRFNGNQSAVNAPAALYPCTTQASLNANFGTQAGTQAQSGNVVCVSAQGGTGTLAGQGTTQSQNFNNQTNQTNQNSGTTGDNGNNGTTGTGTGDDSTTGTGSGDDSTTGTGTGTGNG